MCRRHFLSLEEALADPIYAMPDDYVGHGGISWLYHLAPAMREWAWEDASWAELFPGDA